MNPRDARPSVAALMAGAALLAACASPQSVSSAAPQRETAILMQGRQVAEARCGSCHAVHATGASPRRGAPALRDIGRRYPMDELETAVAAGMVVGHPDMPQILLEPGEHEVFFAYLRSLQPPE